ncbi:MAG: crossover junction endodeoxyribonuclease RuvC, partial [Candidatus Shapirobacteria bacterium]|nr:crossover junction endodeoxyribonuclease RuvC [Candidatus Shapirobacteria bacterium]
VFIFFATWLHPGGVKGKGFLAVFAILIISMVLGIDPGLASCGWAILPDSKTLSVCGCLVTTRADDLSNRLGQLYQQVVDLCQKYRVEELAIESLFFAKNTKTALLVAQVMGAIKAAAYHSGVRVFEYTPLQIKIAITGYGRADKNQIAAMVKQELGENDQLVNNHAADAVAAALTHLFTMRKDQLV